jgi:hypothetical protein
MCNPWMSQRWSTVFACVRLQFGGPRGGMRTYFYVELSLLQTRFEIYNNAAQQTSSNKSRVYCANTQNSWSLYILYYYWYIIWYSVFYLYTFFLANLKANLHFMDKFIQRNWWETHVSDFLLSADGHCGLDNMLK